MQVGDKQIPAALPTVRTYRGKVKGNPNTLAFIAAEPNGNVSGFIRFNGQENFSIGVASRTDSYTSMITPMSTIPGNLTNCEMNDEVKYSPNGLPVVSQKSSSSPQIQAQPLTATKTCVLAIDEDYACYQEFGNYVDYITARLAAITTVYESEIGVAMTLGPFNYWTTPDPYNGGSLDPILQSFTSYWAQNHQSDANQRTLAHLISRKLSGGGASGIAWLAVMCDPNNGYGLTNISGNSPGIDESVMAHELGHNVGSAHTHNCAAYPPSGLDHCVAAEGGCSWSPVQSLGCIMSYCNNKTFSFDTPNDHRVVETLQAAVDAATCLTSLAKITLKDTAVNFPKTAFNTKKDSTLTAIVTNSGSEVDLKILGATIGGRDATEFSVKNPPKFPVSLSFGQTLTLTVTFNPTYGGDDTAQLRIAHNATGGSSFVQLTGRGAVPVANFIHLADIFDFQQISDRNPHDSALIYVQNDGDASLTVTSSKITGAGASEFSIVSGGAPSIVAPGQQGSILIRFKAKTNGFKSGFINFKTNDPLNDPTFESSVGLQADVSNLSAHAEPASAAELFISPNPFSRQLQVELRAGAEHFGELVSVNIFDNLGRKAGSIDGGKLSSSSVKLTWQPDFSLSEGTYTLIAKIGGQEIVKQIVYIK